jgi:hypothetical protein
MDIVLVVFCIDVGFGRGEKLANFNTTFKRGQMKGSLPTEEN